MLLPERKPRLPIKSKCLKTNKKNILGAKQKQKQILLEKDCKKNKYQNKTALATPGPLRRVDQHKSRDNDNTSN